MPPRPQVVTNGFKRADVGFNRNRPGPLRRMALAGLIDVVLFGRYFKLRFQRVLIWPDIFATLN